MKENQIPCGVCSHSSGQLDGETCRECGGTGFVAVVEPSAPKVRILNHSELSEFVRSLITSGSPIDPVVPMILGGDRLSCCDEAVAVEVDGVIVGVATIAPQGEMNSGEPTIVGNYVLRKHRSKGLGTKLMAAAVERCRARGFSKVRVDVMSTHEMKIIEALPDDLKSMLDVQDHGAILDMFI